ncbi:MAG TPA: NAD-dependent epimerase/dehydratase family protein, partial [Candidatus Krumholzibacteria bacterium]|nr:NAD-dependent epimerase/dehydratase family protein [Candidatus Krumholzibacteria bacterium]
MAKVLITGGAGFIGSHIAAVLVEAGDEVRILDDFSTGFERNVEAAGVDEVFRASVTELEKVREAVKGCDYVFHEAALASVPRSVKDPLASNAVNVAGTLNVLVASRDEGVKRVIYAASSSAYGDSEVLPKVETMRERPKSPYAVAKLAGEQYVSVFAQVYGMETLAIRYFNVFGPRQDPDSPYAAVIPLFLDALLKGEPPTIHGDGEQSRDFTYVENVVHANLLALRAPKLSGEVVNVALGDRVTLNELYARLAKLVGSSLDPVHG